MDPWAWLQERAEAIVRRGRDVRQEIANVVAAAVRQAHGVADGFAGLLRATVAGAARAVENELPADGAGVLRQVVDGVGDGLSTAAHAAELTLREATTGAAAFARADLERLASDFGSLSHGFVDSVAKTVTGAGGRLGAEVAALRAHAAVTLRRIEPSLAAAVAAARRDPLGLGREALAAGAAAVRGAAGALFTAIGKRLEAMDAPRGGEPPRPAGS
jgi:hypothetical protein